MSVAHPVRVVVVGTGFGARVVAPAFAAVPGCEVAAVLSARDGARIAGACARPDVELVSVHSPPFLHAEHVHRALDHGKAVLCDKPFGLDAAEAEAMLAAAETAGVVHLCNFEFRHDAGRRRVREIVRAGALGRVEHLTWSHHSRGSRVPLRRHGWLFDRSRGGGWVGAWASHAIDALRWILDDEVEAVTARLRTTVVERPDADGVLRTCTAEDGLTAALTTARGVGVLLDSTYASPVTLPARVVVTGSEGVLESVGGRRLRWRTRAGEVGSEDLAPDDGDDPHTAPMRSYAHEVVAAVRAGTPPPDAPTFAAGLACARVLDRLRASPHDVGPTP